MGCLPVLKTSPSGGVTTFSHVPEGAWSHTCQPSFSPITSVTCELVMVALRALRIVACGDSQKASFMITLKTSNGT